MEIDGRQGRRWPWRLLWMLALYAAGLLLMGAAAWLLKWAMHAIGLSG
jgi:hypothetical protein